MLADRFVFVLGDAAVKAALLLTLAAVLVLCSRRASASFRHLVWALGLGGALFLPLLSCNLPHWRVFVAAAPAPVHSALVLAPPVTQAAPKMAAAPKAPVSQAAATSEAMPGASALPLPADAPQPAPAAVPSHAVAEISWLVLVIFVWLIGTLLMLAQLARGLAALREVSRGSVLVMDGPLGEAAQAAALSLQVTQAIEVRQAVSGSQVTVPLTYGARRPVVVLPAGANQWPMPRLNAALLHEMAHVKRRDWALQMLSQVAGALYWFHPLVWVARSQMRTESEAACDDLVLAAGVPAPDYARHLLDVALSVRDLRRLRSGAVAMAQSPKVEGRLRAVLASGLSRRPVARRAAAGVLVTGLLLLVPLAALRLVAQVKQTPVPAADALQLHGDFTLRYAVTIKDMTPVAAQLREYQQIRAEYAALLKQDPYFQPVPAEYYAPFSYFQERQPRTRHVVLTVSSHNGQLLWRSEEGGDTFAVVYNGKNGTQLFSNGEAGRIEPGFKFSYMNNCPLPAVGLPDIPLLKGATLLSTPGTQQTWQGQCPLVSLEQQGEVSYTDAVAHVTQDGGAWKMLDIDSLDQRLEFLQHQKFQGLWIASHMTLTKYADDTEGSLPFSSLADLITYYDAHRTPTSICEYRLLSASATPLDLSAAGMYLVSAAPHGPVDPAALQVQALDGSDVQEALHLRFHLQPWAGSHRDLLQQMALGQRGAAANVAAALAALPFPLWSGDPRSNHVWDGDPRVGHAGQPPQLAALRLAGPVSASRDFVVARSRIADARSHVPHVVLWASGRLTMTTAGVGPETGIIEQDVTPPFLADSVSNTPEDAARARWSGTPPVVAPMLKPAVGFRRFTSQPLPDGSRYTFLYPSYFAHVQPGCLDGPYQFGTVRIDCIGTQPVPWIAHSGQQPISYYQHNSSGVFWLAPHEEFCSVIVGRARDVMFPPGKQFLHRDNRWIGQNGSHHDFSITDARSHYAFELIHEDRYTPALFKQTDPVIDGSFRILPAEHRP